MIFKSAIITIVQQKQALTILFISIFIKINLETKIIQDKALSKRIKKEQIKLYQRNL